MSKKISVIIPAYNAEKYIERTLKSVINQTYSNLEIIVIDDGSTDNTLSLCNEYSKKDKRIIVYHKDNEGVSKARDLGIRNSTGEYIGFVDSDDTIEPNMYEILLSNMLQYDADISHCGYKKINKVGNISFFYNTNVLKIQDNVSGLIDLISGYPVEPSLWTKLFKRDILMKISYDKTMRINEDYVINLLAFKNANRSVFYDVPLYNYCIINDNSGSSKIYKEYFYRDILKAADITLDLFEKDDNLCLYAQRKWFKTYSDMYKNQGKYDFSNIEFNISNLLNDILIKLKENYKMLKNNDKLNKSDKFILFMIRYFPKLLVKICKFR